jgi:hypothetical protein
MTIIVYHGHHEVILILHEAYGAAFCSGTLAGSGTSRNVLPSWSTLSFLIFFFILDNYILFQECSELLVYFEIFILFIPILS